jgi:sugar fermentation stimulation protein A
MCDRGLTLCSDSGLYLLFITQPAAVTVTAGRLPATELQPGAYIYVGRARKNLEARLLRHLRSEKKRFWHIDSLLDRSRIESIWIRYDSVDECGTIRSIRERIPDSAFPIPGFGSSDCRCPSHLMTLPQELDASELRRCLHPFRKVYTHGN